MAATGMSVTSCSEVMEAWGNLKKATTTAAWIKFTIETKREGAKRTSEFKHLASCERDDSKSNEENWNAMIETLTESEGCFVVFDMRFEHGGRQMYRPLLVSWCPDSLGIQEKMLIGSNKDQVKRDLDGIQKSLHASDKDELTYEAARTATL
mmetsp:Transcript_20504/g.47429  ORF Transcript_20504/g.47429 Transcript_20504/m.47429 type:complete len:152 (-) Transcript_20504:96-551(-)